MITAVLTTTDVRGIPLRSALPDSLDRHVSCGSAGMHPAWQVHLRGFGILEEAVCPLTDVQA
jgi:hypothetical protein